MHVTFRTDASLDIGTGHVMRCLTVANALRDKGGICQFVCREMPGNLIEHITSHGFQVHALSQTSALSVDAAYNRGKAVSVPHGAWLGVDWALDARETLTKLTASSPGNKLDWLVVDHYGIDARWERVVSDACRKLLVIDDLADRTHQCDILLDQNIGRQERDYKSLVNRECVLMTGTRYALLRPEFAALRDASLNRRTDSSIRRLLVSLGGIDKDNATGVVLKGIAHCDLPPELEITVVMGEHAPWLDTVREQAARLPWNTVVATNVLDMASLMAAADIAIGAAGTTTWERCSVGLPSLVVGTAENQRYVLSELALQKISVVGDVALLQDDPRRLASLMKQLMEHRHGYSLRSAALTSGAGCERLAELMLRDY